jgi:hypothetical protein
LSPAARFARAAVFYREDCHQQASQPLVALLFGIALEHAYLFFAILIV